MRILAEIKFMLLKNNVHTNGEADLYLEFNNPETQDFRRRISMQMKVPVAAWVNEKNIFLAEKGANAFRNAREWNTALRDFFTKGEKIILDEHNAGGSIDFDTFKERILGKAVKKKAFQMLLLHGEFLAEAKGKSEGTLGNYERWYSRLHAYAPELQPEQVDILWIKTYREFLTLKYGKNTNSVWRELWYVKKLCQIAIKKGWMKVNPYDDYPLTQLKTNKQWLTYQEFLKLKALYASGSLPQAPGEQIKNWLWCAMTGMDYADLDVLFYEDLTTVAMPVDGQVVNFYYFHKQREKNEEWFFVPVVPEALELISPLKPEGKIFYTISNTKANEAIKPVIKLVGIRKHVNFKMARHTCGTLFLNFGARKEVVQDMLGHASPEMTDHYAKMINQTTLLEINLAWSRRKNFEPIKQQTG